MKENKYKGKRQNIYLKDIYETLLSSFSLYVALRRCEKSIQHIHTTVTESLPFIQLQGHGLEQLGKNKLFIKLPKHNHHYLVNLNFYYCSKAVRFYTKDVYIKGSVKVKDFI